MLDLGNPDCWFSQAKAQIYFVETLKNVGSLFVLEVSKFI